MFEFIGVLFAGIKVIALLVLLNRARKGTHAMEIFFACYSTPKEKNKLTQKYCRVESLLQFQVDLTPILAPSYK